MPTSLEKSSAAEATPAQPAGAGDDSRRSVARQWGVLGLLVAILLASFGYLGWHYSHRDSDPLGPSRDSAMAAADKFVTTVNTYGPDLLGKDGKTMPSYRTTVGHLLTTKFKTEFLQNVAFAEATVSAQGAGRSCEIYATGVAAIDDDTATVLVSGGLTLTYPKSKKSTKRVVAGQQQFRVEVTLAKQHGQWLVDDWQPTEQAPTSTGNGVAQ